MHRKQFKISILTLLLTIVVVLIIGAITFTLLEGWSIADSFYFVTMTATTVGYGDFVPLSRAGKIVTIIYSLSIIPFVLYTFSIVAKFQTERMYRKISGLEKKQDEQEEELDKTERKLTLERRKLKEQEEELERTEKKLRAQAKLSREHEKDLLEHEKDIKGAEKKIKKQAEELEEHDKELEVVEDIVEEQLVKKIK
ncbi:two pore domain potassium channel family protein [Candidatus Peregrinibacteria bacterium]|nr:two pore domain potassium channel family protein [Candidatus Peregrinibacteria bacterium]